MVSMNEITLPVPAFYRELCRNYNFAMRARDWAGMTEARMALRPQSWTPEQRAQVDAYNAQVDRHNAKLAAERKAHNARVQARKAAAQRAATHAATCSSCFTIHAGECY